MRVYDLVRNSSGITILYVMAALILAVSIGAALMGMARGEVTTSGDYSGMQSAVFAARSGLLSAQAFCIDSPAVADSIFAHYLDSNYTGTDNGWFRGSAATPLAIPNSQEKYSVKIVGFDQTNFVVALQSTGYGKCGSRKAVTGYFALNNVTTNAVVNTPKNALFLGGGNGGFTACGLTVNGATYVHAPFIQGTAFPAFTANGPFVLSDNLSAGATDPTVLSGFLANDVAYFGRPVKLTLCTFNNKVMFNMDVLGFNGQTSTHNSIYCNDNVPTGTNPQNGFLLGAEQTAFGLSSKSYGNSFWYGWSNPAALSLRSAPYLPDSALGISVNEPPAVTIDLSGLSPIAYAVNGYASNNVIQNYWIKSGADNKRYGGFAFITASGWASNSNPGTNGNVIVDITSFSSGSGDGTAANALTTSDSGTVLVYIDIGAGNTGTLDLGTPFRGMIYVKSGNPTIRINGGANSMNGCIYSCPGTSPAIGGNGGGSLSVTWNDNIMNAFQTLKVFGNSGSGTGTINWSNFSGLTLKSILY